METMYEEDRRQQEGKEEEKVEAEEGKVEASVRRGGRGGNRTERRRGRSRGGSHFRISRWFSPRHNRSLGRQMCTRAFISGPGMAAEGEGEGRTRPLL